MKAIYQNNYGKSNVLKYGKQPIPKISDHQLLIKNHASSVNPRDWMIRSGRYQLQFLVPKFPLILGSDFSGEVVRVGCKVKGFSIGDRVTGMKNPSQGLGTYAEYVAVQKNNVTKIPLQLSYIEAAGIPLCALTAWQALVKKAKIRSGMKILVIGASGGVGSYAVQIACALGASVTAVCSGENKEGVSKLGASSVIDYKKCDVNETGMQYDIIFDTVGSGDLNKYSKSLSANGCYLSTIPSIKNISSTISGFIKAFTLPFIKFKKTKIVMVNSNMSDLDNILKLVNNKNITPKIDTIYNLADAQAAHDYSRTLRAKGKIILAID